MAGIIVVGVDGSEDSGFALDWAIAEARLRGAGIQVVFGMQMPVVSVPFGPTTVLPPSPELRDLAEQTLAAAARRVASADPELEATTNLVLKEPVEALLSASADADLLVVGTRGLGGLSALTLGSVSSRVAARATCPTAVIPPRSPAPDPGAPIAVGVDGSPHSEAALRFALHEAQLRSTSVLAVHAYSIPIAATEIIDPTLLTQLEAAERERATELVDELVQRVGAGESGPEVTSHVVAGSPVDALVEAAEGASLAVVGSRGRSGLRAMILGSVSRALLHRAAGPVVVVREPASGKR